MSDEDDLSELQAVEKVAEAATLMIQLVDEILHEDCVRHISRMPVIASERRCAYITTRIILHDISCDLARRLLELKPGMKQ